MNRKDQIKQKVFMKAYRPIHDRFELFCQARSSYVMDQEDLMNEALYRVYNSWDTIKKKEDLLYFLFGTVKNIILNVLRKKKEIRIQEDHLGIVKTSNKAELDFEIAFLYQQINKLAEEKKEAIILFEISGFSIKEIAEIQETTEGSVNMRLSRARKELKVLLTDENQLQPLNVKSNE